MLRLAIADAQRFKQTIAVLESTIQYRDLFRRMTVY